MCKRTLATAACLLLAIPSAAQEATRPATAPATLITIYSCARYDEFDASKLMKGNLNQIPGLAIIQQRRTLELNEGESVVNLPDIAASADFSTLSLRPASADAFKVLSQTLVEAAGDPDSLLRRAIGHEVIINRKASPLGEHGRAPETTNAKLLAFDQNQLVIETGNRQLPIQIIPRNADIGEIKLMADSAAPAAHSALSARISSAKGGAQEALLSYHATGITWHADYDIVLQDESKARFAGTITIVNRTGGSFDDARVNLVAAAPGTTLTNAGRYIAQSVAKQTYSLPQPLSIGADAAHRVALVDTGAVASQMVLACTIADYGHEQTYASTYLAIDNSTRNHLGVPLPAGRVRLVRQTDASAAPLLLADDILPAIAQNDLLLVRVGPASAVSVKRGISEQIDPDPSATLQIFQLSLHNSSNQPQKVLLVEPKPVANSQILEKSDEFRTQSDSLVFTVEVPANGDKVVSYSVRRSAQ